MSTPKKDLRQLSVHLADPQDLPFSLSTLKEVSLLMASNCVRNPLERFHDRISNKEMQEINQEVSNKIFTFLMCLLMATQEERKAFFQVDKLFFPDDWDLPSIDVEFVQAVDVVMEGNLTVQTERIRM